MATETADGPADILVADDDLTVRRVLQSALESQGHRVRVADDGEHCLKQVAQQHPDLIMCDLNMPLLDGLGVCRQLKSDETTRHIPFVLITGATDRESRLQGIEAGTDDYLNKPLDLSELFARTKALLRTKRLDDEVRRQRRVLRSLLEITTFNPNYAAAPQRLLKDFLHRMADLLRASEVAVVLARPGGEREVIGCYPVRESPEVERKVATGVAVEKILVHGEPLVVGSDDSVQLRGLGLREGFAGVPIHDLDGKIIGAVIAFGMPSNVRPDIFQVLQTLAQRTGMEVQLRDHSKHLEEMVAERTRDLTTALNQLADAKGELERAHEATIFRLWDPLESTCRHASLSIL